MGTFKPTVASRFQAQTSDIRDGQFIVATDSRELFYDDGSLRIPLADIVFLNTESEREEILAPLPKFYFVIATGNLYVWDGTFWTAINGSLFDQNSVPPAGSLPTLLIVRHGKARPLKLGNDGDVLTVVGQDIVWKRPEFKL